MKRVNVKGERGQSMGLKPPFTIRILHNHLPEPVRAEILQKEKTRSIIREANKDLSEKAAAISRTNAAQVQILNRYKAEKNDCNQS